jgi:hypothetical protein
MHTFCKHWSKSQQTIKSFVLTVLSQQVAEKMKTHLLSRQTSGVTSEYNDDNDDEQRLIEEAEQIAAQKSLQRELEFEREMLLEREQRIQQIESNILDVNEIMRELGAMVHEQGDIISKWSRSH